MKNSSKTRNLIQTSMKKKVQLVSVKLQPRMAYLAKEVLLKKAKGVGNERFNFRIDFSKQSSVPDDSTFLFFIN